MVTCCALRVINTKGFQLNLVNTCNEQMWILREMLLYILFFYNLQNIQVTFFYIYKSFDRHFYIMF